MDTLRIRPYESKDFDKVLNFDSRPSKRRRQKLRMLELSDVFYALVAEYEGEIYGLIVMQDMGDEKSHQIMQINVREKRKGIGKHLMEEIFQQLGPGKHISLAVLMDNEGAIAFYEAMGFKRSGHTHGYKKDRDYFWYQIDI